MQEIELQKSVDHPNVAKILGAYDYDDNDQIAITMEYLDGGDLIDFWDNSETLTSREAFVLAEQIIKALQAIHEAGIAHFDIKPFHGNQTDLISQLAMEALPQPTGWCLWKVPRSGATAVEGTAQWRRRRGKYCAFHSRGAASVEGTAARKSAVTNKITIKL